MLHAWGRVVCAPCSVASSPFNVGACTKMIVEGRSGLVVYARGQKMAQLWCVLVMSVRGCLLQSEKDTGARHRETGTAPAHALRFGSSLHAAARRLHLTSCTVRSAQTLSPGQALTPSPRQHPSVTACTPSHSSLPPSHTLSTTWRHCRRGGAGMGRAPVGQEAWCC